MSPIRWLNVFLLIENVCGIYRNYSCQTRIKKVLIIMQVSVQNLIHLSIVIHRLYLIRTDNSPLPVHILLGLDTVPSYISYWISVVYSITSSCSFASYFRTVTQVYENLKRNKEIVYSYKKIYRWASIAITILFFMVALATSIDGYEHNFYSRGILEILRLMSELVVRVVMAYEQFVLFIVVMTIVDLSKTLISLISEAQLRVDRCGTGEAITGETVSRWVELYRELVSCCDKVAVCFGCQWIFSITITITHIILLICIVFYSKIILMEEKVDVKLWLDVISYVIMMSSPILASQMASNQWAACHRVLARLQNSMINVSDAGKPERKMVKDFIRLMKQHPLHIRFTSKVPAGIFLLPAIFAVIANYVIILLQFNHII